MVDPDSIPSFGQTPEALEPCSTLLFYSSEPHKPTGYHKGSEANAGAFANLSARGKHMQVVLADSLVTSA